MHTLFSVLPATCMHMCTRISAQHTHMHAHTNTHTLNTHMHATHQQQSAGTYLVHLQCTSLTWVERFPCFQAFLKASFSTERCGLACLALLLTAMVGPVITGPVIT